MKDVNFLLEILEEVATLSFLIVMMRTFIYSNFFKFKLYEQLAYIILCFTSILWIVIYLIKEYAM